MLFLYYIVADAFFAEGICNVLGFASRVQLLKLFQMETKPGKLEMKVVVSITCAVPEFKCAFYSYH